LLDQCVNIIRCASDPLPRFPAEKKLDLFQRYALHSFNVQTGETTPATQQWLESEFPRARKKILLPEQMKPERFSKLFLFPLAAAIHPQLALRGVIHQHVMLLRPVEHARRLALNHRALAFAG